MLTSRPYVLPKITERGTIRLLGPQGEETDLRPADAAELAVQLLRTYNRTYPMRLDLGDGDYRTSDACSAERLEADPRGTVRLHVPGKTIFNEYRAKVLRDVRLALGIRP